MSPEERQLLAGLFERTKSAASAPRDQEAEAFINEQVKAQPAAPYLLAQTVIVQDQALQGANARMEQLEAQVKELEAKAQKSAGGFLGGLFGGAVSRPSAPPPRRPAPPPGYGQPQGGPWGQPQPGYGPRGGYAPPPGYAQPPQGAAPQAGGGFLTGALGTAAGVAGGVLLADGIRHLFQGGTGAGGMGALAGGNLGIGSGYVPAGETTVINNYYGEEPGAQGEPQDQPYEAGYDNGPYGDQGDAQDADFDYGGDGGFDSGDLGGGDDSYDV